MNILHYFGRATIRIDTTDGRSIYIDPYAEGDYSKPADLVLVSHGHGDHNAIQKVTLKPDGLVIAAPEALADGLVPLEQFHLISEGGRVEQAGISVQAVPAYNKNHDRRTTIGFILRFEGLCIYHASDTSYIPEMAALATEHIDYALLPTDGHYNMDGDEARRCADIIKPRFAIAIHSSPNGNWDAVRAAKLSGPDVIALAPGEKLELLCYKNAN
ncbi:MAG: MBL fold metallo-hydrolase [Spirochaetes bacterium]|nr:MBL fold metallo-hydrolase [Spirochaetota bacterium]MBU0955558.1 MBL fold metallo-hydrolase [Spirochaetota bacterium]